MTTTRTTDLGTCCISGCSRKATELAAPDVPYCDRHAASNRQATMDYMSKINAGGHGIALARSAKAAFLAKAKLGAGSAECEGVRYRVLYGSQYDPSIIAVRREDVSPTAMSDYFFRPGEDGYERLAAASVAE